MSFTAPGLCESLEYENNAYLPDSGFYCSGFYPFHGGSGERRFLISAGGRHHRRIGDVCRRGVYFPVGADAEEKQMIGIFCMN